MFFYVNQAYHDFSAYSKSNVVFINKKIVNAYRHPNQKNLWFNTEKKNYM